jgi:hypothetical protein
MGAPDSLSIFEFQKLVLAPPRGEKRVATWTPTSLFITSLFTTSLFSRRQMRRPVADFATELFKNAETTIPPLGSLAGVSLQEGVE